MKHGDTTDTGPTIALVEDDPPTRKATARLLRAAGYETAAYDSAEEFLVSLPHTSPFCCIFDIHLGGMSGLELQRVLRAAGLTIPVIVISAFEEPDLREEAYRGGCLAFLSKQSDGDELLTVLQALVKKM